MSKIIKFVKFLFISIFLTCVSIFSTSIYALSSDWIINDKSKVRLISPKTTSDNMNEVVLGLEYELDPGWKTYWKSPGGGGFPQKIIWNNSTNINDIIIDWPVPKEFEILGLTSLGYDEKVIFPLKVKLNNKNKVTNINLNINYLVCKNICIPGNANLFLELPSGYGEYTEFLYDIEKAKSSLPFKDINLSSINNIKAQALKKQDQVEIEINVESDKNFLNPNIFIHTSFGLPVAKPLNDIFFNLKKIKSTFLFDADQFSKENFPIEVIISDKNHNFSFTDKINIKNNPNEIKINNSTLYIILISLLGGLILNLMPCVFPVLSIKLLSVLNTQSQNIRVSFIITALGIIVSFLFLALFFLILKKLEISIAWGMQFQEPYFLIFILLILTFFFLNTLGLFEIELPYFIKDSRVLNIGSNFFTKNFFNGFFATLLATPCTAPFVGTAITMAFTQTSIILFLIFFFMGLGMSIPYILVATFPRVISILPKPGQWTLYTKYFLSFLLILTIFWVINILLSFYNKYFIALFLLLLFFIILSYKFNYFKYSVLTLTLVILFSVPSINYLNQNQKFIKNDKWLSFSDISISGIIAENKIVFLDITADWCATCQFNKLNVLNKKNVNDFFTKNNIVLVRADWTKPNKKIDNHLKKYNKFGIPFNAFYSKKYPGGKILTEILNEKEILNSINSLK